MKEGAGAAAEVVARRNLPTQATIISLNQLRCRPCAFSVCQLDSCYDVGRRISHNSGAAIEASFFYIRLLSSSNGLSSRVFDDTLDAHYTHIMIKCDVATYVRPSVRSFVRHILTETPRFVGMRLADLCCFFQLQGGGLRPLTP